MEVKEIFKLIKEDYHFKRSEYWYVCHSDFTNKGKQVDESRHTSQDIIFPPELMVREINILLNHRSHKLIMETILSHFTFTNDSQSWK